MIQGFRSFADEAILDFDGGLTCIADPEGNGIQDLCDALCFLVGRPAPAERDRFGVFFPGSEDRDPSEKAQVSVRIEEPEGAPLTVSRVLRKNGENHYYINDESSSVEEVRDAVSGAGIEGYTLIDRNFVYDFFTSRYDSIGGVVDRVSGACFFREEAARLETLLAEKRRELQETRERLEECRNRKNALLEESVRAKEFNRLSDMLRSNEMNLLLRRIEQCQREENTASIRIAELNERIAEREKERSETELRITEKKIHQRNLENEEEKSRAIFLNGRNEIGDIRARMSVIDGRNDVIDRHLDLMNDDLVILRERLEKTTQNIRSLERQGQKTEENLTSVTKYRRKTERTLQEKTDDLLRQEREEAQLLRELQEKKQELSALEVQKNGAEKMNRNLEKQRETIAGSLFVRTDEMPEGFSQEDDLKRLDYLAEEKEKAFFRKSRLERSLGGIREKADELFRKQRELRYDLAAEQSRRDLLIDQEKDYESYDTETMGILKDASLPGIYNTAGELLRVRKGYEAVISAAMGSHMKDVICADLASASGAASFLRQQGAGRLMFIPLKELEYKYRVIPEELASADGYVGRALDFTEYDPAYEEAFQYLLGDTVIFRDFPSASRAGRYAGIRIVTMDHEIVMDGEVIESGSLKNTGTRIFQRRGRISASESRTLELEKEYRSVTSEYENTEAERKETETQIAKLGSRIENMNAEISEITLKIQAGEKVMTEARKELLRLREDLLNYDEDTSETELAEQITGLTDQFRRKEEEINQLESLLESCQRQIESRNTEITGLNRQLSEYDGHIASFRNEQKVNRLSLENLRQIARDLESDIQDKSEAAGKIRQDGTDLAREREKLEQEVRSLEADLAERVRVLSSFREELGSLRSQIDRLIGDREKSENEYISFRLEKRALETEQDALTRDADFLKKQLYETHHISYNDAAEQKETVFVLSEGMKESARLRNLLKEYETVNTAAPEEFEKITREYQAMEQLRRELENEVLSLSEQAGSLKAREIESSRKWMDDIGREFAEIYRGRSKDSQATLKTEGRSDRTGLAAQIYIKKDGYTARKLMQVEWEDQSRAFVSFIEALHTVSPSSLVLIDSIDDLLEEHDRSALLSMLREKAGESVLLVTDDPGTASGNAYAYLGKNGGSRELRKITLKDFRIYTPDRTL